MGRASRRRNRKRKRIESESLDHQPTIIKLKQWMSKHNWENKTRLKLSCFKTTGRGVTCERNITINETLIAIPYELMVTLGSLDEINDIVTNKSKQLTIHDLLSIFLVIERHKGESSHWKSYVNTLPQNLPNLPWLCSSTEIHYLPEHLQATIVDRRKSFKLSWKRSKESINSRWKCECCQIEGYRVITLNSFTWAYVMVNTRAVYVDPNIVRKLSYSSMNKWNGILSDEPSMALCPFLDMFNHSNNAKTCANLKKCGEKWMYNLITLLPSKKHEEIFISYGSHDNVKLLCEYGFFIPHQDLDVIRWSFSDILNISKIQLNTKQYKFLKTRKLDDSLYIDCNGLSFNLKAALFVMLNPFFIDWCSRIFSEFSLNDLIQMQGILQKLLEFKISNLQCQLKICKNMNQSQVNVFVMF